MMTMLALNYKNEKTQKMFHLPLSAFKKPQNLPEYESLERILDDLIDEVKADEMHPLALAMQIIGDNLEAYDNQHYPLNF
jgi:HTH-type transcriptional regulator/antitoxin HigA